MRRYILLSALVAIFAMMTNCTDEFGVISTNIEYRGEPVDAYLDITVGELAISMDTRADEYDPYEDTEAERWVNDLWVFQYDASKKTLIDKPQYLTIESQESLEELPVTLSDNDGESCLIYVVTNTGDETWASNETDFATVDDLLADALPSHEPIFVTSSTTSGDLSIPMGGNSGSVRVVKNSVITVPVERMYAKLMIAEPVAVIYIDADNGQGTVTRQKAETEVYSVGVGNIPLYCRVGTLYTDGVTRGNYPDNVQWISRTFEANLDTISRPNIVQPDAGTEGNTYYPYVVYVPENLAGQAGTADTLKLHQQAEAPDHALQLNVVITVHNPTDDSETQYPYVFYPGADIYTDYNIKRNNVYRVKTEIDALSVARVPSANCFVGIEGHTISFFPYYRVETGGGYDFTDYLNPYGALDAQTDAGAKIDHVGIVWQTKDCIGDNSDGSLVYFTNQYGAIITSATSQNGYEQIHVKANKEGNALIAAYDTENNILWSWHIWVRTEENGDPTHPAAAKQYYTYEWDNTQIYGYEYEGNGDPITATPTGRNRVAGYEVMSCNLGALQDEPNYDFNNGYWGTSGNTNVQYFQSGDGIVRTFGMMYQWGRKDPFPPLTTTQGSFVGAGSGDAQGKADGINTGYYIHDYSDEHTQKLYGNDNETEVHKTSYDENGPTYSGATKYDSYLFHSHIHESSDVITGMRYSIAHPTVFLCGTKNIAQSLQDAYTQVNADWTNYVADLNNYIYKGGWSDEDEYDAQEWGSSNPSKTGKYLDLGITDDAGYEIYLYDDYGTQKSIFDPCPYGWRVSSGDLWLGFSVNGINLYDTKIWSTDTQLWNRMSNANYYPEHSCLLGMTMYLGDTTNRFRVGDTSWFPTQGFLLPDGCGYRVGGCGNYVNANADSNPSDEDGYARVYITHIHAHSSSFKVLETQMQYTVKSTGGPLRCIRDQM